MLGAGSEAHSKAQHGHCELWRSRRIFPFPFMPSVSAAVAPVAPYKAPKQK